MPNHEGKELLHAPPGSPAWTRNAAYDRMAHAERVAAYYREQGDDALAATFDRQAALTDTPNPPQQSTTAAAEVE